MVQTRDTDVTSAEVLRLEASLKCSRETEVARGLEQKEPGHSHEGFWVPGLNS